MEWKLLEAAVELTEAFASATEGVFTALSNMEWFQLVVPKAGVYTGPGVSSAIAANRIRALAACHFCMVCAGTQLVCNLSFHKEHLAVLNQEMHCMEKPRLRLRPEGSQHDGRSLKFQEVHIGSRAFNCD